MALTNFGDLTEGQLTAWSRDLWKAARNNSFVMQFAGSGPNAPIQRITTLTKSSKGTKAVLTLLADLTGDGIVGDGTLEGAEEQVKAYDISIQLDQLRNANRIEGRMADQKTIVNFRQSSRDVLAYWIADRIDQLAFLTLTGKNYTFTNTGAARAAGLNGLAYNADVTAPTSLRHRVWVSDGTTSKLVAGDEEYDPNQTFKPAKISYQMLVEAKAFAKTNYIRGIRGAGNQEYYHVFVTPAVMADLKLDADFMASVQNAGVRGSSNTIWTGAVPTVDGLVIHEHRHVYNTVGAGDIGSGETGGAAGKRFGVYNASAGYEWDGCAVLFVGAQALALADIGLPYWVEDTFDYGNQLGISVGKIFGMKKPVFESVLGGSQDFGVLRIDVLTGGGIQ